MVCGGTCIANGKKDKQLLVQKKAHNILRKNMKYITLEVSQFGMEYWL